MGKWNLFEKGLDKENRRIDKFKLYEVSLDLEPNAFGETLSLGPPEPVHVPEEVLYQHALRAFRTYTRTGGTDTDFFDDFDVHRNRLTLLSDEAHKHSYKVDDYGTWLLHFRCECGHALHFQRWHVRLLVLGQAWFDVETQTIKE